MKQPLVCSLQTASLSAGYAKSIPFMALLLPADSDACLSFHGLLADSCSSKAKSVACFTDKGLLPCGFTTWQLRDRGKNLF